MEYARSHAYLGFIHQWSATVESADDTAVVLACLTAAQRKARAAAHPEELTWFVLDALIDIAVETRRRNLAQAVELAAFVEEHAAAVTLAPGSEFAVMTLRARAARELGTVLRQKDDEAAALLAFQRAAALFDSSPAAVRDSAAVRRFIGLIHHHLTDSREGLAQIRASAEVFRGVDDRAGLALSLVYEASVVYEAMDARASAPIFHSALAIAEETGDEPLQAALHANLAHCAIWAGDIDGALTRFTVAIALYEKHGLLTDFPRILWGFARMLGETGAFDEAIREFVRVAHIFRDAGMPLEGARAILDAIELAVLSERADRIGSIASALTTLFTEAGLHREAVRAFAYIRNAADRNTLTSGHIRHAWEFVRSLRNDDEAVFYPLVDDGKSH